MCFPLLLVALLRGPLLSGIGVAAATAVWLVFISAQLFDPEIRHHALYLAYINQITRLAEFCAGMIVAHMVARSESPSPPGRFSVLVWTLVEIAAIGAVIWHNGWIGSFVSRHAETFGPVVSQ